MKRTELLQEIRKMRFEEDPLRLTAWLVIFGDTILGTAEHQSCKLIDGPEHVLLAGERSIDLIAAHHVGDVALNVR
jgi:hypothetical protein